MFKYENFAIFVVKRCPLHAQALRVFVEADNYPILIHCIHGKDRTGAATRTDALRAPLRSSDASFTRPNLLRSLGHFGRHPFPSAGQAPRLRSVAACAHGSHCAPEPLVLRPAASKSRQGATVTGVCM